MKSLIITTLFLIIGVKQLTAQKITDIVKDENGNIQFAKIDTQENFTHTNANVVLLLQMVSGTNNHFTFKEERNYKDELGYTHHQYQVFFDNILVLGMDYNVHVYKNKIYSVNGYAQNFDASGTKPSIDINTAMEKAKTSFVKSLIVQDKVLSIKSHYENLVFLKDANVKGTKYKLAYKFLLEGKKITEHAYIYVDANNASVLGTEEIVCSIKGDKVPPPNSPGTAQTRYTGTQNFTTDAFSGNYRLREVRSNVNIFTLNAQNSNNEETIPTSFVDFIDNNNDWLAAEHGSDQSALDVHWATEKVFDYWKDIRGRNSINGNGMQINSFVHYGLGEERAFWLGISRNGFTINSLYYGDGYNVNKPLVSLDIVSHEIGHGITQFTANLRGNPYDESKALNEGFSDIWGAVIEAYAAPNKQRWLIGEEVFYDPAITCIRNLQNPKTTTGSQQASPDTYLGINWEPGTAGVPHINSTVLSHWFYLITMGGSGTNDIGSTYCVNAIGMDKAAAIAYRTLQLLSSSSNYSAARTMSIQAARELYGVNSLEEAAVTRGWYAAGVGANYSGSVPLPTITGNDALCTNSTGEYNINNSSSCLIGVTNVWSITKADGSSTTATVSPLTGNNTTVTIPSTITSGSLKLTGTLSNGTVLIKNIYIGSPNFTATYKNGKTDGLPVAIYYPNSPPENFNNVCIGYSFLNMYVDAIPVGTNNVAWSFANGFPSTTMSMQQTGNRAYFGWNFAPPNPPLYLQATVNNSCGSYSQIFAFKQVNCGTTTNPCALTSVFTISPNPTNGFVKIGIEGRPPPPDCLTLQALYNSREGVCFNTVNIYNQMGSLLKTQSFANAKQANISLQNFVNGTYRVEIIAKDGYKETKNIVVQK